MSKRRGASRSFTVFAIIMAAFLILGTVVVFGGSLFGADELDGNGNPDTVEEETTRLQTAIAENPDDADSAAVLANIYANQGNIAQAIPLYEQATVARPDDGNLRLAFGIALLRNSSFLDAQVQLDRALDLLPDNAGPAYYRGQLEQLRPEPDQEAAREWYEMAIEIAPESGLAEQARQRINEIDGVEPTPTPSS